MHTGNESTFEVRVISKRIDYFSLALCAFGLVGLCVGVLLPFTQASIPPLIDYPNHLARIHVLKSLAVSSEFEGIYEAAWGPIPNLAMDAITVFGLPFLNSEAAGFVFLLLAVAVFIGGSLTLNATLFGRLHIGLALPFLTALNIVFAWGFLNFYFSVGLMLFSVSVLIQAQRREAPLLYLALSVLLVALYFSHIFGYLFCLAISFAYLVNVNASRLRSPLAIKSFVRFTFCVIPSLAIFAFNHFLSDAGLEPMPMGSWWGDLHNKAMAFLGIGLFQGDAPDWAVCIFVLLLYLWLGLTGRVSIAPSMRLALGGLFVGTIGLPAVLFGVFLDARVGLIFMALLVASSCFEVKNTRINTALVALAVCLSIFKGSSIAANWNAFSENVDELKSAVAQITPRSKVIGAFDLPGSRPELTYSTQWRMATGARNMHQPSGFLSFRNIDSLAVIFGNAFVPTLFTYPSTQPIRTERDLLHLDPIRPSRALTTALLFGVLDEEHRQNILGVAVGRNERIYYAEWPQDFDYLIVFGPPKTEQVENLQVIENGSFFKIYRIKAPS
ncbi:MULTISPECIES: hypothetical protein [unclassified Ruegeria]|uniref:hypothetical protein n=1 Tax=unclassified Ruegeria TaxID=2625375 RepID=UPI001487BB02|nr:MULTISPECIES: hypothetical protein [unclassified Ruegeria]